MTDQSNSSGESVKKKTGSTKFSILDLAIDQIIKESKIQTRVKINDEIIEEYAEAMNAGESFPPVITFWDQSLYWLADGFHRIEAAKKAGRTSIECEVRKGTQREAILFAVSANAAHGLRRTNEDKRKAVMILLEDEEWSKWSDGEIARQCGVSDRFVSKLRKQGTPNSSENSKTRIVKRKGKLIEMNTQNIGSNNRAITTKAVESEDGDFDDDEKIDDLEGEDQSIDEGEETKGPDNERLCMFINLIDSKFTTGECRQYLEKPQRVQVVIDRTAFVEDVNNDLSMIVGWINHYADDLQLSRRAS